MSSCRSCGHELGEGRFCTHCGTPVDDDAWRTDTAERHLSPAVPPRTPPSAAAPPPPPRYPLYADEVVGYTPYGPLVPAAPIAAPTGAVQPPPAAAGPDEPAQALAEQWTEDPGGAAGNYADSGPGDYGPGDGAGHSDITYEGGYADYDTDRRSPVLWILVAALVLVLIGAGWWFLVGNDGSDSADRGSGTGNDSSTSQSSSSDPREDVARSASAQAPRTAPPNQDVNGAQVSYDASNMLDGNPETAWRVAGDAKGMRLTFVLAEPTTLHQVGLINGYAKSSTDGQGRNFDWYAGNRRVRAVVWRFDDGTTVRQRLTNTRELQMVEVPAVSTSKVILRLATVTKPGRGPAARNFTAISEVSLVGETG